MLITGKDVLIQKHRVVAKLQNSPQYEAKHTYTAQTPETAVNISSFHRKTVGLLSAKEEVASF